MAMSIGNLVGVLAGRKGGSAASGGDGDVMNLLDMNAVHVIKLIQQWGFDVFRKDFATQNVTGKML